MQLTRHELGLESQPVDAHKLVGVLGPFGQLDIAHSHLLLSLAHVVLVEVEKHLGQIVELGYELFHIGRVALTVLPRSGQRVKRAVGVIEFAVLQIQKDRRERLHPHQPVECECGC